MRRLVVADVGQKRLPVAVVRRRDVGERGDFTAHHDWSMNVGIGLTVMVEAASGSGGGVCGAAAGAGGGCAGAAGSKRCRQIITGFPMNTQDDSSVLILTAWFPIEQCAVVISYTDYPV